MEQFSEVNSYKSVLNVTNLHLYKTASATCAGVIEDAKTVFRDFGGKLVSSDQKVF